MFEIRNSHAIYRNFILSNYEYKKKWFTMEEILQKSHVGTLWRKL